MIEEQTDSRNLVTGLTAALVLLLAVADKRLVLFVPADSGTQAEAIVVLGRGTELAISRFYRHSPYQPTTQHDELYRSRLSHVPGIPVSHRCFAIASKCSGSTA